MPEMTDTSAEVVSAEGERTGAQRDPEATRARILEAARAEFSNKGLGGARVNTIAAEAGVNKQLIYY